MKILLSVKKRFCLVAVIIALIASPTVMADQAIEALKKNLAAILTEDLTVESIEPLPMPDTYMVKVGGQTVFIYSSGDYLMIGEVYDTVRAVSFSDELRAMEMAGKIGNIPESEMILMGEATGRYVTVFTDIDCPYCQLFDKTVPELQSHGLQVRYLMFPRAGLHSESYDKAVSVWCAENQAEAMTMAKSGGFIEPETCDNPVARQYQLGKQIGVKGTPTLVLDNGIVIPGFLEVEELLAQAGIAVN